MEYNFEKEYQKVKSFILSGFQVYEVVELLSIDEVLVKYWAKKALEEGLPKAKRKKL